MFASDDILEEHTAWEDYSSFVIIIFGIFILVIFPVLEIILIIVISGDFKMYLKFFFYGGGEVFGNMIRLKFER